MGNHEITCEFCHEDQRAYGGPCCDERKEYERKIKERRDKEEDEIQRYLLKFGIKYSRYSGTVNAGDIVNLLQIFDGKVISQFHPVHDNTCKKCKRAFIDDRISDTCILCTDDGWF